MTKKLRKIQSFELASKYDTIKQDIGAWISPTEEKEREEKKYSRFSQEEVYLLWLKKQKQKTHSLDT